MRVVALDPGRIRDAFGLLVADIDAQGIRLLNTREWFNKDFFTVGKAISKICEEKNVDMVVCETNNQGHPAIDTLNRFYGIEAKGITTVKDVKSREKLRMGSSMPKNVTVEWVEWALQMKVIQFPQKPWPRGIKRLDEQMAQYIRKVTSSGTKYEASDVETHDDLVSCLLIMSHYARIHILQLGFLQKPMLAGVAYGTAIDTDPYNMTKAEKEVRARLAKKYPDSESYSVNVTMPEDQNYGR